MLSVFRKSPKLVVIIFALVALAFIATGVLTREMPGTTSLSGGGTTVATVGGEAITATEMEQRIRNQYAQSSQQQPGLDMASFVAQAFDPIVEQTIGATALEAFGRSIGLVASKKQVDGSIAAIPAFHGPDGNFSQQVYLAAIAQQHIGDAQVRSDLGGDLIRRMVYLPATGALTLPDGVVKAYAGLIMEQRAGSIGFVPTALTGGGTPPSDADVAAFYKAHVGAYTTPERRVLRYAMIGRDQVAAAAIPSEADIRKVYDTTPDKYAARETRDISQVVLPSEAAAKAFKATVTGGKSFADAAKAAGFGAADIAIGDKSQAQYAAQSSPAVAAAAFALPQGGVSDPVKSDFGWHVVKVGGITRIAATPYATARAQIAGDLAKAKQDTALAALLAKVQDALSNGQGFADVAKANGLTPIDTPAITAGGIAPDQAGYKPAPEVQPLLAPGFKAHARRSRHGAAGPAGRALCDPRGRARRAGGPDPARAGQAARRDRHRRLPRQRARQGDRHRDRRQGEERHGDRRRVQGGAGQAARRPHDHRPPDGPRQDAGPGAAAARRAVPCAGRAARSSCPRATARAGMSSMSTR